MPFNIDFVNVNRMLYYKNQYCNLKQRLIYEPMLPELFEKMAENDGHF